VLKRADARGSAYFFGAMLYNVAELDMDWIRSWIGLDWIL